MPTNTGAAGEERHDVCPAQTATQHAPAVAVRPVHLEHVLGYVEGRSQQDWSWLPPWWDERPYALRSLIAATGGAVHAITCDAGIYDLHVSGKAPLATEAITRIQALYAIEDDARGRRPDERRQIRQTRAKPLLADMKVWLEATRRRVPRRGDLAAAIHYVIKRWTALTRYVDDREQVSFGGYVSAICELHQRSPRLVSDCRPAHEWVDHSRR